MFVLPARAAVSLSAAAPRRAAALLRMRTSVQPAKSAAAQSTAAEHRQLKTTTCVGIHVIVVCGQVFWPEATVSSY